MFLSENFLVVFETLVCCLEDHCVQVVQTDDHILFFKCQTVKSKPHTTYTGLNVLLLVVLHPNQHHIKILHRLENHQHQEEFLKRFLMMMCRFLICKSVLGNTLLTRENRYENAPTDNMESEGMEIQREMFNKCSTHVLRGLAHFLGNNKPYYYLFFFYYLDEYPGFNRPL